MTMSDNDDIDNDDGEHHTGMWINVAMCVSDVRAHEPNLFKTRFLWSTRIQYYNNIVTKTKSVWIISIKVSRSLLSRYTLLIFRTSFVEVGSSITHDLAHAGYSTMVLDTTAALIEHESYMTR